MQWAEVIGYVGAFLTLITFSMQTMLKLRKVAICSNVAFITYGLLLHVYPVLVLHTILLPLNILRLRQLLRLTRQVKDAVGSRLSLDWLKPFSRSRTIKTGEVLFRRGDDADQVLFILSGQFRAVEADVVLGPGEVFGELGLITKGNSRTQTVVCEGDGVLLMINYDEVRRMYYQNPEFGFFFLELAAERLMRDANQNKRRLEQQALPAKA